MSGRYGLEIRAATAADAPGLALLLGGDGRAIEARGLAERIEALRRDHGLVLVALEWGPPSGCVALDWYRTLAADAPTGRINTLVVAPDARRRGIGRLLLKAAAQAARMAGCDTLELALPPDQAELRAFGAATGFVEAGTVARRSLRKKSGG